MSNIPTGKNRSLSADLHKFHNQLSTASLHHITRY